MVAEACFCGWDITADFNLKKLCIVFWGFRKDKLQNCRYYMSIQIFLYIGKLFHSGLAIQLQEGKKYNRICTCCTKEGNRANAFCSFYISMDEIQ